MSLEELAGLIRERNRVSGEIARIIGRPALSSHIGEYVASMVFGIGLEGSATARGIDGRFSEGPLKGRTVNVKLYGKKENILDISLGEVADYYLVFTGPDGPASSSRGEVRPLVISQVFLFNMGRLVPELRRRGVKIGVATSVRKRDWDETMVYPVQRSTELVLDEKQVREIALFSRDDHDSTWVEGYLFQKVCNVEPVREETGEIVEDKPCLRFNNVKGLRLHNYGEGPFCVFRIPSGYNRKSGVYMLRLNEEWVYVGKAEDLGVRFNQGYGNISPRNCFEGGRQTNCRINHLILDEAKKGLRIELFFHETDALDRFERELIHKLRPQWNGTNGNSHPSDTGKYFGKYIKIGTYLSKRTGNEVTLTFPEIEEILGFKLPDSAYNHRPWWSNSGHTQCGAWTSVGWHVDSVSLGSWVRFRKESDDYV